MAVFIGLVNLIILTDPNSVIAAYQKGNVGWYEALPPALVMVVASPATWEVVLRRLKPAALADKFSHRYGISVFTVYLGGAIMGFLLAAALTLNRVWFPDRMNCSYGYRCRSYRVSWGPRSAWA